MDKMCGYIHANMHTYTLTDSTSYIWINTYLIFLISTYIKKKKLDKYFTLHTTSTPSPRKKKKKWQNFKLLQLSYWNTITCVCCNLWRTADLVFMLPTVSNNNVLFFEIKLSYLYWIEDIHKKMDIELKILREYWFYFL